MLVKRRIVSKKNNFNFWKNIMKNYISLIILNFMILGGIQSSEEALSREQKAIDLALVERGFITQEELQTLQRDDVEIQQNFKSAVERSDEIEISIFQQQFLEHINKRSKLRELLTH